MLARSGDTTDPCPVPLSLTVTTPFSRMPARSHFWIRRIMRGSPIRSDQPVLTDLIEEAADISIQYPVHLCAADSDDERVQCIMWAAARSKTIREPEEILLIDRV